MATDRKTKQVQQVAVITGGGSGIGAATARLLASLGWQVIISGRTLAKLKVVSDDYPSNIRPFEADVLDESAIAQLFADIKERFGRLDLLVHAAGIFNPDVPILDMSFASFQHELMTNAGGTFIANQAALRIMVPQGLGIIINISSLAGIAGLVLPERAAYSAAKHAVSALTETVRGEHPEIKAFVVCPGLVHTPMTEDWLTRHPEAQDQGITAELAAQEIVSLINQPDRDALTFTLTSAGLKPHYPAEVDI